MPGSPDLSEFDQYERKNSRQKCKVRIILDDLPDDDRAKLEAALVSDRSNRAILHWLKARGIVISNPAVTTHRHGSCLCHGPTT
jgi:hypothetical protein